MSTPEFATFDDFFPFYCSEHSRPLTRWLHFAGTHAGGAVLALGLVRRRPLLLALAPAVSYGTAWAAHFLVERNRPATFAHPVHSLHGDMRMIRMMWAGRDAEVQRLADEARIAAARPIVLEDNPSAA